MITRVSTILLAACITSCASTPATYNPQAAIIDAQNLGKTLYEDINSEDGSSAYTSREADLIRMIEEKDMGCEGTYKAVSTFDEASGIENLFLVLYPDTEGMQFGRHFRFRFKSGTDDLIDVTPSTKSCLLIPALGDSVPFVTHLLSETPDEFHVFLSLLHKKEIFVSTSSGLWSVQNGEIKRVEK